MSRTLLLDSYGGRTEWFHGHDDGSFTVSYQEDCEGVVNRARQISEMEPGKEFRHAAVIPHHVLEQSYREGWFHDPAAWKRWANDPSNRAFRTWEGRL